jgi:O-antigen ligase
LNQSHHHTHIQVPMQQRLLNMFPPLLAFLLPFGSAVLSWVIVAWALVSFFNGSKFKTNSIVKSPLFWSMPLYFLLTIISAVSSETASERVTAIEVKLSFLLFPYLLACFNYSADVLKRTAMAFVSGCFFTMLALLVRAAYYTLLGESGYFYYTQFSNFIHASYFSMYLFFAVTLVLIYYPIWFVNEAQILKLSYFYLAVLILGIFLCASKLGLISFFLLFPLLLIYRFRNKLSLKKSIAALLGLFILSAVIVVLLPTTAERFKYMTTISVDSVDKGATESTAVRILIWKECLNLIKEEPLFGYGVADANEVLYGQYQINGVTGALEHHFNAHNQYFQTAIGMGGVGVALLFGFTLFALISAIRKKQFLLFVISVLFCLNFLVESMLQTAAGVIFVGFMFNFVLVFQQQFPLVGSKKQAHVD